MRIFSCECDMASYRIAIFMNRLPWHTNHTPLLLMSGWKSAMRQLTAEARLHLYARSLSRKTGIGLHAAALYGAFAIIVGVVFGTLSVHPF
jgi:hypothetical protein